MKTAHDHPDLAVDDGCVDDSLSLALSFGWIVCLIVFFGGLVSLVLKELLSYCFVASLVSIIFLDAVALNDDAAALVFCH